MQFSVRFEPMMTPNPGEISQPNEPTLTRAAAGVADRKVVAVAAMTAAAISLAMDMRASFDLHPVDEKLGGSFSSASGSR